MRTIRTVICLVAASLVLAACGEAEQDPSPQMSRSAPPAATRSTAESTNPTADEEMESSGTLDVATDTITATTSNRGDESRMVYNIDPAIVGSLEELVDLSPIIFIGTVRGRGEVVNTARDVNDISRPDEHLFHLGQVYEVQVERYLRGEGPDIRSVVQMEGVFFDEKQPLPPTITSELVEAAREQFTEYIPMEEGMRYLFFVKVVPEIDPSAEYVATSYGFPWRFTLPESGQARPVTPYVEANELFPPQNSEQLIQEVEDLTRAKP